MLNSLIRLFERISYNLLKIVATKRDFFVVPVICVMYFPVYKLYLPIVTVLFLIYIISYLKHYFYNENIKRLKLKKNKRLFKQFRKTKKKYSVALHERIFSLFPYFLFFFEIYCSYPRYSLLFLEQNISSPDFHALDFIYYHMEPCCYGLEHLIGSEYGLTSPFTFYFQYYFIARIKKKSSYFTRYHFVFCLLMGMILNSFTQLFYVYIPPEYLHNWFSDFIGLSVINFWACIFLYGLFNVILGKQPIIPFIDESIQYHIGNRLLEDEEVTQYDDDEDDEDDDEYD